MVVGKKPARRPRAPGSLYPFATPRSPGCVPLCGRSPFLMHGQLSYKDATIQHPSTPQRVDDTPYVPQQLLDGDYYYPCGPLYRHALTPMWRPICAIGTVRKRLTGIHRHFSSLPPQKSLDNAVCKPQPQNKKNSAMLAAVRPVLEAPRNSVESDTSSTNRT